MIKKSKRKFIVAVISGSLLGLIIIGTLYFNWLLAPVNKTGQAAVIVEVPNNSSSKDVGAILKQAGLIKNSRAFSLYSRIKGLDGQIKAGEFKLAPSLSTAKVLQVITNDNQAHREFTVPEGYTVEQIAELLETKGYIDKDEFLSLCRQGDFDYSFLQQPQHTKYPLEGYLFPDTYKITSQDSEKDIIITMLDRFAAEIGQVQLEEKSAQLGLSVQQAVTIASMIEREAMFDQERPLISGVIQNRLQIGMPLQIDATVLYALGKHKDVVLYKDLEVDSPYNTYRVGTLPPGPIASPGFASLEAAVAPQQTDCLYYLAKPDGSHVFSKTLDEHNRYKAKYL